MDQSHVGPPSRIWTGEIEEHITSDVAYAAHNYWRWTGDDRFMRDEGIEIIVEGARYWASRLEIEPDGPISAASSGPTNTTAMSTTPSTPIFWPRWHLQTAADLVERRWRRPSGRRVHVSRLGIGRPKLERWRRPGRPDRASSTARTAFGNSMPGSSTSSQLDLSAFEPRERSMYDLLGEERAERTQVIKQADVVMAMSLFPEAVGSRPRRKRNWDYYLERCDQGSSLSMAVHARVAADLGLGAEAYDMFRAALAIDLEDVMGNGRDGLHAATQGGILQATIFGFAGLRLEGGRTGASAPPSGSLGPARIFLFPPWQSL